MPHEILEDLRWRYTTKKYDPSRKVSEEDLAVLLEALRLSASSINSQPWRFVVIESEAAKARMNDTFARKFQFNQPHILACSHVILFAHNPRYVRDDFAKVVDRAIVDQRVSSDAREKAFSSFMFAELNTDATGSTAAWTKNQTYIALGNALHTLARLKIDSTTMEGIDVELVNELFKDELAGYQCEVALTIGYRHPDADHNASLPKSRLALEDILVRV